jgi:hypothetical protein
VTDRNWADWWNLKDAVKVRCCRLCEFCLLRCGDQLHHRHYRTWGRERPEDVMLVCDPCHRVIEGLRTPDGLLVRGCSLAKHGDSGKGDSPLWRDWLAHAGEITSAALEHDRRKRRERARKEWERVFGDGEELFAEEARWRGRLPAGGPEPTPSGQDVL